MALVSLTMDATSMKLTTVNNTHHSTFMTVNRSQQKLGLHGWVLGQRTKARDQIFSVLQDKPHNVGRRTDYISECIDIYGDGFE